MITGDLEIKRRPRLPKPCVRCKETFTPKGLGHSESLCRKCWSKARSRK
ncbi:MAG TPA: hypothetical protein VMZ91_12935 [Candidatus Paceibacterota bacterium]|nr:hypothetical protein [Candidatus Paceibacterota bacterium]